MIECLCMTSHFVIKNSPNRYLIFTNFNFIFKKDDFKNLAFVVKERLLLLAIK